MTPATLEPGYRLVRPSAVSGGRRDAPELDEFQRAVVAHASGPQLVLAGPGTGKTTTMVEAIADRVEVRGADPASILALTFSRKAAEQLRDRVTARLGRTTSVAMCSTFHSFAYGLVRRYSPAELYSAPLRLLSAPEQDVVLRELLLDSPESVSWPASLARAAGTRGFAHEVAAVLGRAREKGLDGPALAALGREHGLAEFVAAGYFLEQYLSNLDFQGATDYPDLLRRAVIEAEDHREELRAEFTHVFVDEYQDTDPGQVRLLQALAGDGGDLTVVGDPHQSIYAFRGAEVRGILDFPDQFRHRDGRPADVRALGNVRRFGPRVLTASRRIASRLPLTGTIDAKARAVFSDPTSVRDAPGTRGTDRVEVLTVDTERAEVERLADLMRRAHLEDGVPWSEMAVLVRSGRASIPVLRRGLAGAGVPVEVASDETPLAREPAVSTLVAALRTVVVLDPAAPDPAELLDPVTVEGLLLSPMVGLDATDVRALSRRLREEDKRRALAEERSPRSSADLLRAALVEPELLGTPGRTAADTVPRKVAALASLLQRARSGLDGGDTVEEVLWRLWAGTSWPEGLRQRTVRGGAGARLAHRDLDAVVALFESAARAEEQAGHKGVAEFLATIEAQEIPGDSLADRGVRGDAVRLLTAHRSKGLEWRLVVVAHVQEGAWPDLRRRSSLLHADRIGAAVWSVPVLQPETSSRELLAEERRLFYVACTRARERLVVSAVASPDDEGEQPSRFLGELGVEVVHRAGRPPRPLSLPGLVAELRRTVSDPGSPPDLRRAAVRRLAALALQTRPDGRQLVPGADPASWWGTRAPSLAPEPLRPADRPVELSASALAGLLDCPAQWFLEREAGGSRTSSQAQGFGNLVHAIADRVAKDELGPGPVAVDQLMTLVDEVWDQLTFRTPWSRGREREEVRKALSRFVDHHQRPGAREVLATEQEIRAEVVLPDGESVVLRGYADRLELDEDGRVVVVDLKTGKYAPTDASLAENPQLGLYQHAVDHGALDSVAGTAVTSGGAELWQLRKDVRGRLKVQAQPPQEPDGTGVLPVQLQLTQAAAALRQESFPAQPSSRCDRCQFVPLCPAHVSGSVLS
ncbi:MAG: ATP-dependent helicase [Marmoricola sp.]|nr:ATP-dependent helicase [Marmoricola sp.]